MPNNKHSKMALKVGIGLLGKKIYKWYVDLSDFKTKELIKRGT